MAVFVTRRVAGRVATTLGPGAVHSTAISASGADRADVGRVASGREAGHAVGVEPRVERLEVQSLHQVDLGTQDERVVLAAARPGRGDAAIATRELVFDDDEGRMVMIVGLRDPLCEAARIRSHIGAIERCGTTGPGLDHGHQGNEGGDDEAHG